MTGGDLQEKKMSNPNIAEDGVKTQFKTGLEQVNIARLGGIASGEKKREQKRMKEIALKMLNASLPANKKSQVKGFGLDEDDLTYNSAVIAAQVKKALKGDSKSATFLQDVSGQKINTTEISGVDGQPISIRAEIERMDESEISAKIDELMKKLEC